MATVRLLVSTSKALSALVSEALFGAGAQGIEQRAGRSVTLVVYGESRRELRSIWKRAESTLAEISGAAHLQPTIEVDDEETWRTAWMEHLRPVALTSRLTLAPTTQPMPVLEPRRRLILYAPALAFGDGDHPTTRLAARAIETHYRASPGGALLDIGAGTGVLSFVAVLSGARRALGIDVDPEAIRASTANAALNGLDRQTRFMDAGARIRASFDLAVINIELRPLLEVLSQLPAAARRAPKLLVTGFLASQRPAVSEAVKGAGFTPVRQTREGDWRLLTAENAGKRRQL